MTYTRPGMVGYWSQSVVREETAPVTIKVRLHLNRLATRLLLPCLLLFLSFGNAIAANGASFEATANLSASANRLNGQVTLTTEPSGTMIEPLAPPVGRGPPATGSEVLPLWRQLTWLWAISGLLAVGGFALGISQHGKKDRWSFRPLQEEWLGGLTIIALFAWTLAHAAPQLWLTSTWSTGGDIASHVFYAREFMNWLPTGKFSGWLPESFAGFPAFTFYFPFPYALAGLLQFAVGQQVAFKLVSMLPAFFLLPGTYLLCRSWGWAVPVRLLAAAGATGFIISDATSIWGGNILAQLAGEFAYSWGLLLTVLFWGVLSIALKRGGRWWLAAGVLEALLALSHGYALLIAGFGAFVYLLFSRNVRQDLRIILQVHLLAFLLIGFWLIPLAENLPWTIPNDTPTVIDNWRILWPASLWPLAIGWIPLVWLLTLQPANSPSGIFFLVGIGVLGLLGFIAAERLGLAGLRFFPYAQWAFAVASGGALGWVLYNWNQSAAVLVAMAFLVALSAWWEPRLERIERWSTWNLSGYESKPMWPHYLATAQVNEGLLQGPRLVFEHDPANNDLGSTRALEALPMFGSRPVLEGLYMESAVTGPFIYQLQAEISERPSSPLSRYPSTKRSIDQSVDHLNELFVNRVVLRSARKKAEFGSDHRFRLVAEHGPLQTYELKTLRTQLIETLAVPAVPWHRDKWLDDAFARFVSELPYIERHVYLTEDQSLPQQIDVGEPARVEITRFSRERLVFETNQPGAPHLIRMSYHPRWKSQGGEPIYLTEPSFMLIYPLSESVTLEYSWGPGDWIGLIFSVSGIALLVWGLWPRCPLNLRHTAVAMSVRPRHFSYFLVVSSFAILTGWWMNPERVYQRAHLHFTQEEKSAAAPMFEQAYKGRHGPAKRAEALFWAARSWQLAGELPKATERYSQLTIDYRENYWYPESVFRLIEIYYHQGNRKAAEKMYTEFVATIPDNKWTREAASLLAPVSIPPD